MADVNIKAKIEVENIGTLKQQLREAQNDVQALADKFGATSVQAIEAAKRASDLKDRIGDAKSLVDAFNPDAKFKSLTAALSGAAGGFAAVQGAIGLVGVESKEVEATLLKVNSAMALSEGLQNVGESVDSFKQLGAVIKSTTAFRVLDNAATVVATVITRAFGVAVDTTAFSFKALKVAIASTGIGVLVVALGFVIEKLISFANASDKATEKQKELNKQIAEGTKQGLAANEKFIDSDTKLKLARAKLRGASEKELFEIEQQGIREKIRLRQDAYEQALKNDKDLAKQIAEDNAEANLQLQINQIDFNLTEKKRELEKQKELARIKKEAREKEAKEEQDRLKEANKALEDSEKRRQELNKGFDKIAQDKKEEQAKEEKAIMDKNWEETEANAKEGLDSKDKKITKDKKDAANVVVLENEKRYALQLTGQALNEVGEIIGKQTAAGKALGTATALINTFLGITEIWRNKTTIPEPFGTIQKIAATTVAAASGFAAVKGIMRTQVPGGGGGGGSIPSMSTPLNPAVSMQGTQLNQASIQGIGNAAAGGVNRSFILEADINNSNERQVRLQRAARLG